MSALVYSPADLLLGKAYYSQNRHNMSGLIQEAIPADSIWYENAKAFTVRVRPTIGKDFWATVCVATD